MASTPTPHQKKHQYVENLIDEELIDELIDDAQLALTDQEEGSWMLEITRTEALSRLRLYKAGQTKKKATTKTEVKPKSKTEEPKAA